ncbi:hypothetical protein BP00DRAFT_442637 [Aspergillus indologenus CBS 114.80]|uniref:Uncharacterized protein n=1 Tax=Aspergillus indologenus CBS 114.80 TaxID=1450541 RepID=A0A2V5JGF4_9EURO|nr:hypothetical protein BP00DRAFT_442637 [Aspergillus indologenus CBS 114.80]
MATPDNPRNRRPAPDGLPLCTDKTPVPFEYWARDATQFERQLLEMPAARDLPVAKAGDISCAYMPSDITQAEKAMEDYDEDISIWQQEVVDWEVNAIRAAVNLPAEKLSELKEDALIQDNTEWQVGYGKPPRRVLLHNWANKVQDQVKSKNYVIPAAKAFTERIETAKKFQAAVVVYEYSTPNTFQISLKSSAMEKALPELMADLPPSITATMNTSEDRVDAEGWVIQDGRKLWSLLIRIRSVSGRQTLPMRQTNASNV